MGLTYAAVPLYKMFCQVTGFGGTPKTAASHGLKIDNLVPNVAARPLTILFFGEVNSNMRWKFYPQQSEITVFPGETALAFYTAHNPTDEDIIGVSSYNVVPSKAAPYFTKIQCFCFEDQRLRAHESVDMPVFFYIDPEIVQDPMLQDLQTISILYTFFKTKKLD